MVKKIVVYQIPKKILIMFILAVLLPHSKRRANVCSNVFVSVRSKREFACFGVKDIVRKMLIDTQLLCVVLTISDTLLR